MDSGRSVRAIIVYRNQPLPVSETFVYHQAMGLERFEAYIVGSKFPQGPHIPLPAERVYVANRGGLLGWAQEVGLKVGGWPPPEMMRWMRDKRPALVHAHFAPDGAVAMHIATRLRVPLVVSVHGSDVTMSDAHVLRHSYTNHRLYLLRRRRLAGAAARVVVQSDFLRSVMVHRHAFPEHRIALVRLGVDLDRLRPVAGRTERGSVLYVGRLTERKGLRYLIHALRLVRTRLGHARLTVIGDGPMRANLEALAAEVLGDGFVFLGAQPERVVREQLERADVFCMPSITMPSGEVETLGVVFLEAMAMMVPVVSCRSGGIPEVVVHGSTGLLADERDVDGLARHLTALLDDRELRDRMGRAGRDRVEQEFDLVKQNRLLEDVYDAVLAEHEGTRGRGV